MSIEKDPVCQMEATDSKITSVYQGKTYRFCSESCKISFEQEPEKFIGDKKDEKQSPN